MAGKINYIKREFIGPEKTIKWTAFNDAKECIASAKSKNECMRIAREKGYVIPAKATINIQ